MNALVVDTSVWIDYLRGASMPLLERALELGAVVLPPIVCAELLSAPLPPRKRAQLSGMLEALPLHPTGFDHWADVGKLRGRLLQKGFRVSTPDAHVAQCALDHERALLWSTDAIFSRIARHCGLKLL